MSDEGPNHTRIDVTRTTAPRRLVAIMMADIVDYAMLTHRNERGTHLHVERLRDELILPTISEHHGTLRKQRGDGFLCTFDSPVECVRCAIIIQQSMIGHNLELPQTDWIRFRIGINVGDVIIASDDIYGDGVNVAARLEQQASPGSIYISGAVYEQIRYKLVCGYESLGDRRLKNIQDPVPIYRVLPDPSSVAAVTKRRWLRLATVAGITMITIVVGGGAWFYWRSSREPSITIAQQSRQQAPALTPIPITPIVPQQQPIHPEPVVEEVQPRSPPSAPQPAPVTPPSGVQPVPQGASPPMQLAVVTPNLQGQPRVVAPEAVQIDSGSFEMGSNEDPSEQPAHRVTVNSFLIGREVVMVGQWRQCVQARACSYVPNGADDQPLGNVSWNDTQQYLAWLTSVTHRQWRLPTEAEWEYAARGGTRTRFWWGEGMKPGMAICKGCGEKPLKIAANPFGLLINDGVAEWVQDCWEKDYRNASSNSSARIISDCRERVLRGASASNDQSYARTASRDYYDASVRYPTHGFRIAASQ